MNGWETLLAAVGGMLVGLGLGVTLGRRGEMRYRAEHARLEASVRTSVVPVLEARAEALGVATPEPVSGSVSTAVTLADAIRRHEARTELPYTDTLALDARALVRSPTEPVA